MRAMVAIVIARRCEACGLAITERDDDGAVMLDDGTHWHRACLAWVVGRRMRERGRVCRDVV